MTPHERRTLKTSRDNHLAEMEKWAGGSMSYTNTVHDPARCAIMDAMEVVKRAAAAAALSAVLKAEKP